MREKHSQHRFCKIGFRLPQRIAYLLLLLHLLFDNGASHANEAHDTYPTAKLMQELDALRQANNVAALGLVIVKNDKVSLLEVRGLASRESSAATEVDAIFRIGSISKMFAGLAAANLAPVPTGMIDPMAARTTSLLLQRRSRSRWICDGTNYKGVVGLVDTTVFNPTNQRLALGSDEDGGHSKPLYLCPQNCLATPEKIALRFFYRSRGRSSGLFPGGL
ncbi:MAG: hypothetical protein ACJAUG_002304 [Halioglobus sp.]